MADITRRTAKVLIDQMLNQYKQVIQDCIDVKTEIPAEALYIVNDYEKNDIGKVIVNAAEEDTLKCAMDRIFDDVMIFNFSGSSHRGQKREAFNLTTKKVQTVTDTFRKSNKI